jgi:hypothetical protein
MFFRIIPWANVSGFGRDAMLAEIDYTYKCVLVPAKILSKPCGQVGSADERQLA